MKKVLILGATGFIGGHIAKKAMEQGWIVRGLRRNPSATGHIGKAPIKWVDGNLNDRDSLIKAMGGVNWVFHAAGYYPTQADPREVKKQVSYAEFEISNVLSCALESGVQRLIYTSSLTTIGQVPENESRLADERDVYIPGTMPKSGYYEAKIVMEQAALSAVKNGVEVVVLNPTAVFGPGDVNLTLASILIAVAKGWVRIWVPSTVNVVDVRDVASGHIKAAERGRIGERYILGGENLSLKKALTLAAIEAKSKPPWFEIPYWVLDLTVKIGDIFPFLPLHSNHLRAVRYWQGYNPSKARAELDFTTRPFTITIRDAYNWLNDQGLI
jgi:dihydroflavonol-4-reductase